MLAAPGRLLLVMFICFGESEERMQTAGQAIGASANSNGQSVISRYRMQGTVVRLLIGR
jgi:hypothetical protein